MSLGAETTWSNEDVSSNTANYTEESISTTRWENENLNDLVFLETESGETLETEDGKGVEIYV